MTDQNKQHQQGTEIAVEVQFKRPDPSAETMLELELELEVRRAPSGRRKLAVRNKYRQTEPLLVVYGSSIPNVLEQLAQSMNDILDAAGYDRSRIAAADAAADSEALS